MQGVTNLGNVEVSVGVMDLASVSRCHGVETHLRAPPSRGDGEGYATGNDPVGERDGECFEPEGAGCAPKSAVFQVRGGWEYALRGGERGSA